MDQQTAHRNTAKLKWLGQITADEALKKGLVPHGEPLVLSYPHCTHGSEFLRKGQRIQLNPEALRMGSFGDHHANNISRNNLQDVDRAVAYSVGGRLEGEDYHLGGVDFIAVQVYRRPATC